LACCTTFAEFLPAGPPGEVAQTAGWLAVRYGWPVNVHGRRGSPMPSDDASLRRPGLSDAVGRVRAAGLLASEPAVGSSEDLVELTAPVAGEPWSVIRPLLAGAGFAEVGPDPAGGRLFAAYDAERDRWLRLRLALNRPATGPGRRSRIRPLSGLIVAVLGPDGSGKSTLTATLAEAFILPVSLYYAGLYPADRRRYRQPAIGTLALVLRLWRLALLSSWQRSRGRLVLFDRYAYDARLPLPPGASRRTRLRRGLLARALPAPDLVVVLDAPVDVLLGRRQEHPAEVIAAQRQRYAELANRARDGVIVDASVDAETVRRTVTAQIWTRFVRRRGGRAS
jgi:thymidylate kinase